jgi:hypothetical protein
LMGRLVGYCGTLGLKKGECHKRVTCITVPVATTLGSAKVPSSRTHRLASDIKSILIRHEIGGKTYIKLCQNSGAAGVNPRWKIN